MFNFANKLRKIYSSPKGAKPRKRVCLEVESLEHRLVPTVGFKSALGGDTIFWPQGNAAGQPANQAVTSPIKNNPTVLNNPEVDFIFWGKSWTAASAQKYFNDATAILQSGYTSGLTDYGSDGLAHTGGWTIDNTTAPPLSPVAATLEIDRILPKMTSWAKPQKSITEGALASTASPIYVVVFDNGGANAGNGPDKYTPPVQQTHSPPRTPPPNPALAMNHIWMGGNAGEDNFTDLFSHELAERISSGAGGIQMNATNANTDGEYQNAQISDNEPDNANYTYRLNASQQMQAYWSISANEFVVPDGDPGPLYELTPSWTAGPTPTFNNSFSLAISPASGDNVIISETKDANGNNVIDVNWNGHTDTFDSDVNKLTGIAINLKGAANVTVQQSVTDVPVTINGGRGTSNVTVGNGNVLGMKSSVTVNSIVGRVNLIVDDSSDKSNQTANVDVANGKLTGLAPGGILFTPGGVNPTVKIGQGSVTVDDSASTENRLIDVTNSTVAVSTGPVQASTTVTYSGHISTLKVIGGSGNDTFQVDSTAAGTQTTLATGTGTNDVFIGEQGMSYRAYQDYTAGWTSLQKNYNLITRHTLTDIAGPVNVQANASGKTSLTVDDSGEAGRTLSISSNSVTFSGVPAISYSGLSSLNVVAGAEKPGIYVGSVPSGAPVTVYNASSGQVWGPAASKVHVVAGMPSWDSTNRLPYHAYVPQYVNWNLPTPDPLYFAYYGVQPGYVSQIAVKSFTAQAMASQAASLTNVGMNQFAM
jgi:hypothetical protein